MSNINPPKQDRYVKVTEGPPPEYLDTYTGERLDLFHMYVRLKGLNLKTYMRQVANEYRATIGEPPLTDAEFEEEWRRDCRR